MKKTFFLAFILAGFITASAQVSIGTKKPDASSILHLKAVGNTKGFILPRISGITSFASATSGILFYNTSVNALQISRGNGKWYDIKTGAETAIVAGAVPASNGVGLGTNNPDGNAILDIVSTTKGVLLPITTADPTGAAGMVYYNSTDDTVRFHDGSSWITCGKY